MSDLVDQRKTASLQGFIGASKIVIIKVVKSSNGNITFVLKLLDMKTAVIESMTVQTMEKLQDLNLIAYKMVQELFHKRIKINPNLPRLALLSLNYPHQYVSSMKLKNGFLNRTRSGFGRYIVLERSAIEEVLKSILYRIGSF